jgi:hypothetical protein
MLMRAVGRECGRILDGLEGKWREICYGRRVIPSSP